MKEEEAVIITVEFLSLHISAEEVEVRGPCSNAQQWISGGAGA